MDLTRVEIYRFGIEDLPMDQILSTRSGDRKNAKSVPHKDSSDDAGKRRTVTLVKIDLM